MKKKNNGNTLLKLQRNLLLEKSILMDIPYTLEEIKINSKYINNFIIRNLFLMKDNNLELNMIIIFLNQKIILFWEKVVL
jgi:hypothetical protein